MARKRRMESKVYELSYLKCQFLYIPAKVIFLRKNTKSKGGFFQHDLIFNHYPLKSYDFDVCDSHQTPKKKQEKDRKAGAFRHV